MRSFNEKKPKKKIVVECFEKVPGVHGLLFQKVNYKLGMGNREAGVLFRNESLWPIGVAVHSRGSVPTSRRHQYPALWHHPPSALRVVDRHALFKLSVLPVKREIIKCTLYQATQRRRMNVEINPRNGPFRSALILISWNVDHCKNIAIFPGINPSSFL